MFITFFKHVKPVIIICLLFPPLIIRKKLPVPQLNSLSAACRKMACRKMACRKMACRKMACRKMACRKMACRKMACRKMACRKMACRKINEDVGYARNTKSGSKGAVTLYEVRLDTVLDSRFRIRNVESGIRTLFMTLEIIHFINVQLINVGKN